ncbi:MAG TPA: FtsX-like permease family protein, partial [Blastocatellia bacterium]
REIGIRVALGASRNRVLAVTLVRGVTLMTAGILVGLGAAVATTRLASSLLFRVKPLDLLSFLGAALALGAVGLIACYVPARSAADEDPMTALRCE